MPSYVERLALLTWAFWCLFLNSLYSFSSLNSGSKGCVVLSWEFFNVSILFFNSSTVIVSEFKESRAAPCATKRCASSGTIIWSGFKCNVSINLCLNSES